jgi:hypothetical protein
MEKKVKKKRKFDYPKEDEIIRDVKVNCYDFSDETYINVKPKEHLKMKRGNFEEAY